MQSTRAIVLGITAALVIGCGVVMGVLLHQMAVTLLEGAVSSNSLTGGDNKYSSIKNIDAGPVWTLGLVYVIPGLLAFIAALVQNKCLYITSCIISMLAIVVMGLVIVVAGMPFFFVLLVFFHLNNFCETSGDVCRCRADENVQYEDTPFKSCDFFSDFTFMGIGIGVVIVLAWLLLIAAFIITCIYACRTKRREGTVFTPQQQPMLKGDEQPM